MDIFREVASSMKGNNVFISPISISEVLNVLYHGANGSTAKQLSKYINDNDNTKCGAFKSVSKVYGRYSTEFKYSFLENIGTKFQTVDFTSDKITDSINKWVSVCTNGKINPLLTNPLSPDTCLLVISAVYFKAKWLHPFNKEFTQECDFHVSKTSTEPVNMMSIYDEVFNYAIVKESFGNFSMIELPYVGNTSMIIILPDELDGLDSIEQNLSDGNFSKWCDNLTGDYVDVHIPKFKTTGSYDLIDYLVNLGMTDVFGANGDYSNMCDSEVNIDAVIHKTYIDVNEEYTEAAAATCALVTDGASITKEFRADHPFIYVIRHVNGAVLFIGRFCSPSD
ncbi:serpin [Raccoonpox virus]|uniref:Serpin n=1 Tax=Raccoon poxvirus TaxID=10256 RepID=A0A0G3G097_RACVI|nr:Serpin [Raccoonpox virus]AKJ93819.1 Serpin [Raccoonpox virus]AOP31452.1 serpin [Raccoonpox virus]